MESKGRLRVDERISEAFKDLFIMVNGEPIPINAIGVIQKDGHEYVVLSDMGDVVQEGEFIVYELVRNGKEMYFEGIKSFALYHEICNIWEDNVKRLGDDALDS